MSDSCARCGEAPDWACWRMLPGAYEDGAALPDEPTHFLCDGCRAELEEGDPYSERDWQKYGWDEAVICA